MNSRPSVSVVIAAAGAADTLPETLRAIAAQDYSGDIEVVVAAADADTARAAGSEATSVIDNPSGETPTGLNLAVEKSTGEILIRVDAHSLPPPDYVSRTVDTLIDTEAHNVGGRQVPAGTNFLERAIAAAMSSPFGAGDAPHRVGGKAGPTETVYLGAFRRSVFESLGGYDESYLRHQDYELNHRIRSRGGVVWFDPGLEVTYRPRGSLRDLSSQYFQYGRWKRYFSRRYPGSLRPRQWAPPMLVIALAAALLGSLWFVWLLALPAVYLTALLAIGLASLPRIGLPAIAMPAALLVMHISWGVGFLLGQSSDR